MLHSVMRWALRLAVSLAVLVGVATLAIGGLLAVPVKSPPELPSISTSARAIDRSNLPPVQRFQARDGTELAYRAYVPAGGPQTLAAVLIHGSSGNGTVMNVLGRELAGAGILAIAPDMRGHGSSGTRGDIAYAGQLDDDLADLVRHLRAGRTTQPLALVGHSSGGGFVLRIAAGPLGEQFARYVLLAPYLGPFSATTRPATGAARWAEPDVPRIVALSVLRRLGVACCEQLPVLAFATAPGAELRQTTRYSFRLLQNFGTELSGPAPFARAIRPVTVITGSDDELMNASRYRELVEAPGRAAQSIVLPGIDHMSIVAHPASVAEIIKALHP